MIVLLTALALAAPKNRDVTPVVDGLLPVSVEADKGRVHWELGEPDADGLLGRWLLVTGLQSGVGSNPLGLDRGRLGPARLVEARLVGEQVWWIAPQLDHRAVTDDPLEQRAAAELGRLAVVLEV